MSTVLPMGVDEDDDPRPHPGVPLALWTLHVRYDRTRERTDLTALVEEYTPLALSIAHRLQRHGEPREDLQQIALESLVAALQRFDPERGRPFVAFATPTITGAIKRHFRDRGWAVRAPRLVHDLAGPIRSTRDDLTALLGRTPTRAEVAQHLELEEDTVRLVDDAVQARTTASLDRPLVDGGSTLVDLLGRTDPDLDLTDDRMALADALETLSDRERDVLALYFVDERPQREIAQRYGVSQMQVSRWLASVVGRLRTRMGVVT